MKHWWKIVSRTGASLGFICVLLKVTSVMMVRLEPATPVSTQYSTTALPKIISTLFTYCKFRNFRKKFIFVNSVKTQLSSKKIATLAWFTYISKGQSAFAISWGLYFHKTLHLRSFLKLNPHENFRIYSMPFLWLTQEAMHKTMNYYILNFFLEKWKLLKQKQ